MNRLKRKNKPKVPVYEKQETPPEVSVSENAAAVVWSKDRHSFCEIFFEYGAYKCSCCRLFYDEDFVGYYWSPVHDGRVSLFDTLDKAKQAAEYLMRNK